MTERSQSLKHYIVSNMKTGALEKELPVILSKNHYRSKEPTGRPLLTRLMQKSKKEKGSNELDAVNLGQLSNESNLRRNRLVLEDVMRQRSNTEWLMHATTKINQAVNHYERDSKPVKQVV
jgi:hypothetical protein